ncbi:MAG: hypothetical protein OEL55_06605 [Desulfobulbaceae bacterium]|nr:hypothetical protein [Desulfobulbaceae bacterium]
MQFIKEKKLANGLTLSFTDYSKPLAADRWFVKMQGEIKLPLPETIWPDTDKNDTALFTLIKEQMGDSVSYILTKERNFVDAAEKDMVLSDLVAQVEENLISYLSNPTFAQKLFARKYEEAREQCLIDQQKTPVSVIDDDDSPADFSACFRD